MASPNVAAYVEAKAGSYLVISIHLHALHCVACVRVCDRLTMVGHRSTDSRSMEYLQSLEVGEFEHPRTVVKDGSAIESESDKEQTLVEVRCALIIYIP